MSVILVCVLFVTSVALGAYYGKISSPRYKTQTPVIIFLINNFKIDTTEPELILSVIVAHVEYKYSLKQNLVSKNVARPDELIGQPSPERLNDEMLSKVKELVELSAPPILATATAETVITRTLSKVSTALSEIEPYTKPLSGPSRIALTIAATVLGATGGYIGYRLTYDDSENLDQELVRKTLADPDMWRSSALLVQNCQTAKNLNVVIKYIEIPEGKVIEDWSRRCDSVMQMIEARK